MTSCSKRGKDGFTFKPNFRTRPLTEKFYSKYDRMPEESTPEIKKYEEEIDRVRNYDVRCNIKLPRYSNQTYGWLPGYKIRFLQYCDVNIEESQAIKDAVKSTFIDHISEPLPPYHECSCKFLRKRPCYT